ncbi:NAD-dependent deacetylase [Oryzomicrobium terrae]|uniref:protein acetyllysine N-acetyltransferase n=1 Tax=Oryzomicrobium terrae TaxID=1735038 RepID=A0A5C1E8Z1_9RHOO|nr:NAD-dependent deacylase [Oryzomicrobium terrae]QEL64677.1 NAD-dependent deacetylase [Oryzomicrobium terrae]
MPPAHPSLSPDAPIGALAALLRTSNRVLVITGAGISADSGLPTYRGVGGLYDGELTSDGIPIEEALSGEMLENRPEITWKYLIQIERTCRQALPNVAHHVLAALEQKLPYLLMFTQNIDGFHRAAGSRNLVEVHGTLHRLRCVRCSYRASVPSYEDLAIPPSCPRCFSALRPDVVLFGEALPMKAMTTLADAMDEGFDLVVSIGTSSAFPYIAEPLLWAITNGIPTVEINPGITPLSSLVDYPIKLGAAHALTAVWQALEPTLPLPG